MSNISASELIDLIPFESIESVGHHTSIDYKVHKLTGKRMFSLLLYGLLEEDRMSLRTLEDTFNGSKFKFFFKIDKSVTTKYNSLSDRLATMNVAYFEQIHHFIYQRFCCYYPLFQHQKYHIHRIDSTMVAEQARKLHQGMSVGRKKEGKKQVKYTFDLTDMFASSVQVFTSQSALSEDLTMPITIYESVRQCMDMTPDNVFVFDRGLGSHTTKEDFDNEGIKFVTRIKNKTKYEVVNDLPITQNTLFNLTITHHQIVTISQTSSEFKLIKAVNTEGKELLFLSNLVEEDLQTLIGLYRQRWQIEVFFRFLKQELNLSHLVSMNENGITIILYMTMIVSMLLLIFKKINDWGFKTAKRRFKMQLDDYITALIVEECGGDSKKWKSG